MNGKWNWLAERKILSLLLSQWVPLYSINRKISLVAVFYETSVGQGKICLFVFLVEESDFLFLVLQDNREFAWELSVEVRSGEFGLA